MIDIEKLQAEQREKMRYLEQIVLETFQPIIDEITGEPGKWTLTFTEGKENA